MADQGYIAVHVTPRSGRDELCGIEEGPQGRELRIRVTAAPDDGKANKAVCKLVAQALKVPKTSVEVASGHTSRHKRLSVPVPQESVDSFLEMLE